MPSFYILSLNAYCLSMCQCYGQAIELDGLFGATCPSLSFYNVVALHWTLSNGSASFLPCDYQFQGSLVYVVSRSTSESSCYHLALCRATLSPPLLPLCLHLLFRGL